MNSILSAPTVQTKFDALTMAENPQIAVETGMVDDGSGSKTVELICVCVSDINVISCSKCEVSFSTCRYDIYCSH